MSQSERNAQLSKYDTLKEVIDDRVATITDAESANAMREDLGKLEVIFDSELYWKQVLHEKCTSLGLKYDKLTDKYVAAA